MFLKRKVTITLEHLKAMRILLPHFRKVSSRVGASGGFSKRKNKEEVKLTWRKLSSNTLKQISRLQFR